MEYAFDDGLEIERQITKEELAADLKLKYELKNNNSEIQLEKVYKIGEESYQSYRYQNGN
ncbi:hypothetical protein ACK1KB_04600 [Chryseobacterium sp. TY3]